MVKFHRKRVVDLTVGDIVLHPLYRRDGLILVRRYKRLTLSLLKHIRTQCDENLPVLVTGDEAEFTQFLETQGQKSGAFQSALRELHADHKLKFHLKVPLDAYINEHAQAAPPESEQKSSPPTAADLLEDRVREINIMKSLLLNPLWISLERILESERVQERASQVKNLILNTIEEDDTVYTMFSSMASYHDVLATHSVNTMCIALAIGLALELSETELHNLALATLFADVGYVRVDLREFVFRLNSNTLSPSVTEHVAHSIDIVKESPACRDKSIILGILDHHEWYNGGGYPNGKQGEEITLFGRIIAIAQAYDEQVGGYIQEASLPHLEAQAFIWANHGSKWDKGLMSVFFYRRRDCKVGQLVLLTDGRSGRITGFSDFSRSPLHPRVELTSGEVIDFAGLRNLSSIRDIDYR